MSTEPRCLNARNVCPVRVNIARRFIVPTVAVVGLFLAFFCAGCVHSHVRHDYQIVVHGTLVDGVGHQPIKGIHIVVKVGDRVIYDGFTDQAGKLEFTYGGTWYPDQCDNCTDEEKGEETVVEFVLEAEKIGVVIIPVKFGKGTNAISLGNVQLRLTGD